MDDKIHDLYLKVSRMSDDEFRQAVEELRKKALSRKRRLCDLPVLSADVTGMPASDKAPLHRKDAACSGGT